MPPPPETVPELLADWESFAHEDGDMPLLVRDALLHCQLETIHPFRYFARELLDAIAGR